MLITQDYCVTMARYNAWQNHQLKRCMAQLSADELTRDRGAFFGSILGTANHLLWGDMLWMARLTGKPRPEAPTPTGTTLTRTREAWEIARFQMDGEISLWAERIRAVDLAGELQWASGLSGQEVRRSKALCVVHMFNHQTHHRGQLHAMLTNAGLDAPMSDLVFMPDDTTWV